MLQNFISTNRTLLIERCQEMVARRSAVEQPRPALPHGIPVFLDQVVENLAIDERSGPLPGSPGVRLDSGVGSIAALHGRDLFAQGLNVEQVIREYGDVCQAVTNLAVESDEPISAREFCTFNRCIDDAISGAVTEYARGKSIGTAKAARATAANVEKLETALTQAGMDLARTQAALSAARLDAHRAMTRALHDSLTGLPNRELFDDRLAHAIALADRHNWTLAVMFLDLDQFKDINDAHGHATGDTVLKAIAERLLRHVRDEDTVCRNGGDEFLYLLMNPRSLADIESVAESVLRIVAEPVAAGAHTFIIKPSIGIAVYPEHGACGPELIANADAAMYQAKKNIRGVALFDHGKVRDLIT